MPRRDMWFAWSRAATGRKKVSSLELFIKVYAKYIDCMRVKNSRLAGPCSAGPIPEAFQPPNGKSTAALAVEQLILRIPARTRRRKPSIRFGEGGKMAAAKPRLTPLQSKTSSTQTCPCYTTRHRHK